MMENMHVFIMGVVRSISRLIHGIHGRIQKILSVGSNFGLVDKGWEKYHYKRAVIGPPAKRHLNGVSLAY